MAEYTPTNNPYMPGDPYSYDLKWMVEEVKKAQAVGEEAAGSAAAAAASAEAAGNSAYNAATYASNALISSQNAEASAEEAADIVGPVNQKINVLESRMDTFASLTDGSTTGDAELQDIRVAADGTIYPSAGDAVRGQVNVLQDQITYIEEENFNITAPVWELGTASSSDGTLTPSTTNIRTNKIECESGTKITAKSGFLVMVFKYDPSSGAYLGTMGTWAEEYITDDKYVILILAKYSNSATITNISDVSDNIILNIHYLSFMKEMNVLTPDQFNGNDSEKIQACLNALEITGGIILLNREYVLTRNIRNTLDTNNNIRIALIGIGKDAKITMGNYSITGSTPGRSGGLWFSNIVFSGSATAFDCSALIRMHFVNCYFYGFTNVFYGGNERSESKILQSLYVDMCVFRGITNAVINNAYNAVFDVHVTNCTIEASRNFFISTGHDYIAFLSVQNNCIEGLTGAVFVASPNQAIDQCVFNGNHLEQNAVYFNLTSMLFPANMSICDNFIGENGNKPLISLPAYVLQSNGTLTVERNTLADRTSSCHVFSFPASGASGNYKGIVYGYNRFNNLTSENTYNNYLPPDGKTQLSFSGATFADFVNNALAYLAVAQNRYCAKYSIMWASNGYYTFDVTQFESGKASAFIYNINRAVIAQYTTATTNIKEITLT